MQSEQTAIELARPRAQLGPVLEPPGGVLRQPDLGQLWIPPCSIADRRARAVEELLRFSLRPEGLTPQPTTGIPVTGRAPSTVCREVNANGGRRRYRALPADRAADRRALRPKRTKLARCPRLRRAVEAKLEDNWSPEQISSWLADAHPDNPEMQVSHETIYQSLFVQGKGALRKELHVCLRSGRAMRRAKAYSKASHVGAGKLKDMVMISERPAEVADRAVPSHGEGDLIFGKKRTAIATLVERHSRFVMLSKLPNGYGAEAVRIALAKRILTLPANLRRSPGIRARKWPSTCASASTPASPSTSATPRALGSAAPTRTPTVCCANTCRRTPTCPCTHSSSSRPLPVLSTGALDRHSAG